MKIRRTRHCCIYQPQHHVQGVEQQFVHGHSLLHDKEVLFPTNPLLIKGKEKEKENQSKENLIRKKKRERKPRSTRISGWWRRTDTLSIFPSWHARCKALAPKGSLFNENKSLMRGEKIFVGGVFFQTFD